jgi:hypothetical protein
MAMTPATHLPPVPPAAPGHTHHEGPLCAAYATFDVMSGDGPDAYVLWTELLGSGECGHGSCQELERED